MSITSDLELISAVNNSGLEGSQLQALRALVLSNANIVLLTAPGGYGKTFVAKYARKLHEEAGVAVCMTASTGFASSLYVGATTISSLAGLWGMDCLPNGLEDGIGEDGEQPNDKNSRNKISSIYKRSKLCEVKGNHIVVYVDECSMMSSQELVILVHVMEYMKRLRGPNFRYTIALIGDFRQLAPVPPDNRRDPKPYPRFCNPLFEDAAFQEKGSDVIRRFTSPLRGFPYEVGVPNANTIPWEVVRVSLLENHRQAEDGQKDFAELLHKIGNGQAGSFPLDQFMYVENEDGSLSAGPNTVGGDISAEQSSHALHIYCSNKECASKNKEVFNEAKRRDPNLVIKKYVPNIRYKGPKNGRADFIKASLGGAIPEKGQTLYPGCDFMVRKNLSTNLKNGTIVTILEVKSRSIKVEGTKADGTTFTEWIKDDVSMVCPTGKGGVPLGSVSCLPGHAANALTPWKCQGLTWEGRLVLHLSDWQVHGLTYVALSRATKGENVCVIAPKGNRPHVHCDPSYSKYIQEMEAETAARLNKNAMANGDVSISFSDQGWSRRFAIEIGTTKFSMDFVLGNLIKKSCSASVGSVSRNMTQQEIDRCLVELENDYCLVANKEAIYRLALTPVIRWGLTSMDNVKSILSKQDMVRKLTKAFYAKPSYVKHCLLLADAAYGECADECLEDILASNMDTRDISFSEYLPIDGVDDVSPSVEKVVDVLVEHLSNLSVEEVSSTVRTLIDLSSKLHAYEAKRGGDVSIWNVELEESRVANVTVEGFYLEIPKQEKVASKVLDVQVVSSSVVTPQTVTKKTLSKLEEDISTLLSFAVSKMQGIKGLSSDSYPKVSALGAKAICVAFGLRDDYLKIPTDVKSEKLIDFISMEESNLLSVSEVLSLDVVCGLFSDCEEEISYLAANV